MKKLFLILLLTSYGCKDKNPLLGKYQGFYNDTWWQIEIKNDKEFHFTSGGHCCKINSKGIFAIRGDTLILYPPDSNKVNGPIETVFLIDGDNCLIGIETKFDYCKHLSEYEDWGSRERMISYPQRLPKTPKDKQAVLAMLQEAINRISYIHIKDTTTNLIVKEYYLINKSNKNPLSKFGKPILFLSEQEIASKAIKNYVEIEAIKVGLKRASVQLRVEPWLDTGETVFLYADNVNGEWKIEEEWEIEKEITDR